VVERYPVDTTSCEWARAEAGDSCLRAGRRLFSGTWVPAALAAAGSLRGGRHGLKQDALEEATPPSGKALRANEVVGCLDVAAWASSTTCSTVSAVSAWRSRPCCTSALPLSIFFKQSSGLSPTFSIRILVHLYELEVSDGGSAFFTMELLRAAISASSCGGSAASGHSPADLGRLRSALRQLVEGVHALHSAGKLHRDIKPSNVFVTHEGRVVLLDFGVAAELSTRGNMLPPASEVVGHRLHHIRRPSRSKTRAPSPASDWYSVGVMLYESLVGTADLSAVTHGRAQHEEHDRPEGAGRVRGRRASRPRSSLPVTLDREPERRPSGTEILAS